MAAQSVKERLATLSVGRDAENLRPLISALVDALQAVAAKLDADAGVTDTNYGTTVSALIVD